MSSGRGAKNKSSMDETAGKKKVSGQELEDTSNTAILLALREQEERLTGKVKLAVREAVEEMLAGEIQALKAMVEASNSAVNKLSGDIAQQSEIGRKLQGRLDATSANVRTVKHDVGDLQKELLNLRQKVPEMEDRSRRSNLRLVGLPESAEGENAIQFLQDNLPVWIPSLAGDKIEIQRAHRIFTTQDRTSRPRTLIFRLLRYQDREKILNGARALSSAPTHRTSSKGQTLTSRLLFFPDYSNDTAQRRKAFDAVRKQLANRGLRPFLRYPATLKVRHNGSLHFFESVADAEAFMAMLDQSPRLTSSEAGTPRVSFSIISDDEGPSADTFPAPT